MIEYGELEKKMKVEKAKRKARDKIRNELSGMRIVARLEKEKYKAALKRIYLCKKAGAPDETDVLEKLKAENGRAVTITNVDGLRTQTILDVDENGMILISEDGTGRLADDVYEICDAKTNEVLFKNKYVGKKDAKIWVYGVKKALEMLDDGSKFYEARAERLEKELAEFEETKEKGEK